MKKYNNNDIKILEWLAFSGWLFAALLLVHIITGCKSNQKDYSNKVDSGVIHWSKGVTFNLDSLYVSTDTVYIHDTVYVKSKLKNRSLTNHYYDTESNKKSGCDSLSKNFNVQYWKIQCDIIKDKNKNNSIQMYLPILSPDSCMVSFPL